jgi:hypothetical protein
VNGHLAAPGTDRRAADRCAREVFYAAAWRRWLDEDWPMNLDDRGQVLDEVRRSATVNAVVRLRGAIASPDRQFGRLSDLFRVRRKDLESLGAEEQRRARRGAAHLYVRWLDEIGRSLKDPTTTLSAGADEFWSLVVDASFAAAAKLPELVTSGQFPFQRGTAPPTSLARRLATVIGNVVIDAVRNLGSAEYFWAQYGEQTAHDPLRPVDDDQGRRLDDDHWLDQKATERPTEDGALGPAAEAESLLRRHPYLQDWVDGEPVESIADKYPPTTPAQMFAKILRVVNAYALDELRPPLKEPSRRQWLEQYLPQAIAVRPFHGGAAWGVDELVTLATAVLARGRAPMEADWPDVKQALPDPARREVPATKRRWYRLLCQRPGVALLVPWETWPRWVGPLAAVLPSGLHELEQSDPATGRRVRAAIERLGGAERAAIALAAHHDASEPSFRDLADALTEDGLEIDGPTVARCIEALCLVPLQGVGGFDTLGDLLGSRRAKR